MAEIHCEKCNCVIDGQGHEVPISENKSATVCDSCMDNLKEIILGMRFAKALGVEYDHRANDKPEGA